MIISGASGIHRAYTHEGEHLATYSEWERDDEEHEERHFCYKQEEDLIEKSALSFKQGCCIPATGILD